MTFTQGFAQAMLRRPPNAAAIVQGDEAHASIFGRVSFWQMTMGVVVCAEVRGLPPGGYWGCTHPVLALHIHEGGSCTGTSDNPFADADGHFNPMGCEHPFHAGDLPPLFVNGNGDAWCAVLTDRFTVAHVLGKTVIIHAGADDFHTQPSGNAGAMIACGVIR